MSYQTDLIKDYESKGYTVIKTIRLNKSGFPDLMCMKSGVTVWIESKEPKDTLKPLQRHRIDQLILDGFEAFAMQKGKGKIYPI
tara:strand:+ start:3034 stop:3285 length:252 start_codon:yes stop_codon:yes gene_type:complete